MNSFAIKSPAIKNNLNNFTSTLNYTKSKLLNILEHAHELKNGNANSNVLLNKTIALLFFNPSLRTRLSMQLAIKQLGGDAIIMDPGNNWPLEINKGAIMNEDKAEHIIDACGVLSRLVDGIGVRSFAKLSDWQQDKSEPFLNAFCNYSNVPVINMESAFGHPLQAMADMMTFQEKLKTLNNKKIVLSWAYHPKALPMAVPYSFAELACQLGSNLTIAAPKEFQWPDSCQYHLKQLANQSGGQVNTCEFLDEAACDAEVIYAKSWISPNAYGQISNEQALRKKYQHWRIESKHLSQGAYFGHCLPLRRNVIATDAVVDSPQSIILDQAENRLHVQKAILHHIYQY